jgi:hypothetical protein
MKRETSRTRKSKPALIRTALIGQLGALKKAYAKDVEMLLDLLFPRILSGEFGRDLGEIGEVFEWDGKADEASAGSMAMQDLEDALQAMRFEDKDTLDCMIVACSHYSKEPEGPEVDAISLSFWFLARDIRDAYLARLAQLARPRAAGRAARS